VTQPDLGDVAESVRLAAACGAPAAMVLAVALACASPRSIDEAIAFVRDHADAIRDAASEPGGLARLADLEPALRFSPELARVRPDVKDHELRGKLVFGELLGQRSFFQVAALAIAGLELDAESASLLEQLGINTQLADAGIWPLAATRRVTSRSDLAHGVLAGVASMLNPRMAAGPVGAFVELLDRLEAGQRQGRALETQLAEATSRGERLPGVGRPALGPDERNAQVVRLVRQRGRDTGSSWAMARAIDDYFARTKGQNINSAGLQGAIMRDMGFSASAATSFCVLYFAVPILAHAAFAEERKPWQGL
jgi:hypothetical protein